MQKCITGEPWKGRMWSVIAREAALKAGAGIQKSYGRA